MKFDILENMDENDIYAMYLEEGEVVAVLAPSICRFGSTLECQNGMYITEYYWCGRRSETWSQYKHVTTEYMCYIPSGYYIHTEFRRGASYAWTHELHYHANGNCGTNHIFRCR